MQLSFVTLDTVPKFESMTELYVYMEKLVAQLNQQAFLITEAVNGRITLGVGSEGDNLAGRWQHFTTTGVEQTLTHNLGVIPTGFLVIVPPRFSFIDKGAAAWTKTTISVICGEIGENVSIFILPPPIQDL
jgi:hypothetical protein